MSLPDIFYVYVDTPLLAWCLQCLSIIPCFCGVSSVLCFMCSLVFPSSPEYLISPVSLVSMMSPCSVSSIQDAWCLMSPVFLISPVSLVLQYLQNISVVLATDCELSWEPIYSWVMCIYT